MIVTAPGSVADVGKVIRAIIDRYRAETGDNKINYTNATIQLTGTAIEYIFEMKTYREAIDKVLSMAPAGWSWWVDEIGLFYFQPKATTFKHTFIFGKHFKDVKVERDMEKIRNLFLFWNGELGVDEIYKLYSNPASILQFGRRLEKYFDYAVGSVATADKIALKFLTEANQPEVKVICEIADNNEDLINGYDIENIQPGDTCKFVGFNEQFAEVFRENMLISKVDYSLDKVKLTVEVSKGRIV